MVIIFCSSLNPLRSYTSLPSIVLYIAKLGILDILDGHHLKFVLANICIRSDFLFVLQSYILSSMNVEFMVSIKVDLVR